MADESKISTNLAAPGGGVRARTHVTDLGPVRRVDLSLRGAAAGPAGEETGVAAAWARAQNRALCTAMDRAMRRRGGDFNSMAEWTVAVNRGYDLRDMRRVRTARWRSGGGAAITTLPWAHPAARSSVMIQTTGYVPKTPDAPFKMRAWQPACLYDASFLGLATAKVVEIVDHSLVYLSGVVAWDRAIRPRCEGDPRAQMRLVLRMIHDVFREAGGTPADVVRLRPFTASAEVVRMLREESARLAAETGEPEPVMLVAEESSFWDAPGLFAEIQVMGVVGRVGGAVRQEEIAVPGVTDATTRVRRTATALGAWWHAADLRAPAGTAPRDEARVVARQIARTLDAGGLTAADVCLAMIYTSAPSSLAELNRLLRGRVAPAARHAVYCPPMPELRGGTLKVELTAWARR